jgi:hypothetical protein
MTGPLALASNSHNSVVAIVFGVIIIWVVLLDAFETVVLPRRVTRHFKLTAWFYRQTWIPWRNVARHIKTASRQQNFLGYFGPLSLILLLGFWAAGLILGFALIQRGIGGHEQLNKEPLTFGKIIYRSGDGICVSRRDDWVYSRGVCVVLAA